MQQPDEKLSEAELINRGDKYRQGNPPLAKSYYCQATQQYNSVLAYLHLAQFYLDGLDIDGVKNEILAQINFDKALKTLRQKNDMIDLHSPQQIDAACTEICALLRMTNQLNLQLSTQFHDHLELQLGFLTAIQYKHKKEYRKAFETLNDLVEKHYPPALLELARAHLNNFSGNGSNAEIALNLCQIVFNQAYYVFIHPTEFPTDCHTKHASLACIKLIYELSQSPYELDRNDLFRHSAKTLLEKYAKQVSEILTSGSQSSDPSLRTLASEIKICQRKEITQADIIKQEAIEIIKKIRPIKPPLLTPKSEHITKLKSRHNELINSSESAAIDQLPYIHNEMMSCLASGVTLYHEPSFFVVLQNNALSDKKMLLLARYFLGVYLLENNHISAGFIILQHILIEMQAGSFNDIDKRTMAEQLLMLANKFKNDINDRWIAFSIIKLATEFSLFQGSMLFLNHYLIHYEKQLNKETVARMVNNIGLALWQQLSLDDAKQPRDNESTSFNQLLKNCKQNAELATCAEGLQSLSEGLQLERELENTHSTDRSTKFTKIFDKFKEAHDKGCVVGTLKLAYAYQMNYLGQGVNAIEAIKYYRLFLESPYLQDQPQYQPAISLCIDQLLLLSNVNTISIQETALTLLIQHIRQFTDSQVMQLTRHTNAAARLAADRELITRPNLLKYEIELGKLIAFSNHPELPFRMAAQSILLQNMHQIIDSINNISKIGSQHLRGPALCLLGKALLLNNITAIQKLKIKSGRVLTDDRQIALGYFIDAIQHGCGEGLICALQLMRDLSREQQSLWLVEQQLPFIIKLINSTDILEKLHDVENAITNLQLLSMNKTLSSFKFSFDEILRKIQTSASSTTLPSDSSAVDMSESSSQTSYASSTIALRDSPINARPPSSAHRSSVPKQTTTITPRLS